MTAMTDEELKRLFNETTDRLVSESRRHFDVALEAVRSEVRLVAEGVALLDEKTVREIRRLDEKVDRGFAETQAMIKFSHVEARTPPADTGAGILRSAESR